MPAEELDTVLKEPHLSNRVMSAVVAELDGTIGQELVNGALRGAGLPREYVVDTEQWVSTEFVHRFAEQVARRHFDLDELPPHDHPMWQHWRRAARHALRPEVIGPIYQVLRAFGSPARFYRRVPSMQARANRRTTSEFEALGRGRAIVSVRPNHGGVLESPNCWFQRGLFEAIPTLWKLPPAKVEHRECMLDPERPAPACIYRIAFSDRRGAEGLSVAASLVGGAALGAGVAIVAGLSVVLAGLCGAAVSATILGWRRYISMSRMARRDIADLDQLLRDADERQAELWKEHVALQRSMLVARKLSGYLARDLTERILKHPELQLELGGKHTTAAVLFVDVVGFTPRCERMDPTQLVEELNIYFSHIDPNVAEHDGIIDKRIGDGVMVVFVPRAQDSPNVAVRAVRCAMGMLRSLEACNAELAARNAQPFEIRIGLASGSLVQGNMGSDVRLEYTVIGDVVNLAARLESIAPPGSALVPSAVLPLLPAEDRASLAIGEPRTIRVKGRTGVFDVVDVRPAAATDEVKSGS